MISLYIDKSASMNELGKNDSVEIVLKSIKEQFEDLKISYIVKEFTKIDLSTIGDKTILVSDGLFKAQEIKKGIAIAVGIDANINNLKQVSKKVFNVDEITKIDDYILYNFDFEILEENKKEDDEDEW